MDYSSLSDFEINKLVAKTLGFETRSSSSNKKTTVVYINRGKSRASNRFNPCNNPNDAWPIIDGHNICFSFDGAFSGAHGIVGGVVRHENRLRAAMIVYLMMNENPS